MVFLENPKFKRDKLMLMDRHKYWLMRSYIEGAEKSPLHLLPLCLSEFSAARQPCFIARQAPAFVDAQGIAQIYNLQGGIMAWVRAVMPIAG